MKWPLYFLFAGVTFAAGAIALNKGWNLPPLAAQGKPAATVPTASDETALPACCAGPSRKPASGTNAPVASTTNEAGGREIVLPGCAGKKHTNN
jgi:hypothetical protein